MDSCSEPEISSIAPEDLNSTPAAHVTIRDEVIYHAFMTSHSRKPGDPTLITLTGTLKSGRGSADTCTDQDEIDVLPSTPFLVHFVLGNFFLAILLISPFSSSSSL